VCTPLQSRLNLTADNKQRQSERFTLPLLVKSASNWTLDKIEGEKG
jgi:hypothetical protein